MYSIPPWSLFPLLIDDDDEEEEEEEEGGVHPGGLSRSLTHVMKRGMAVTERPIT